MGVIIAICAGVSPSPISVRLRVDGERGCRVVWIILKVGHTGHVTERSLFIIGLEICDFEVFLEGGY